MRILLIIGIIVNVNYAVNIISSLVSVSIEFTMQRHALITTKVLKRSDLQPILHNAMNE